jgi:hypothetical protein
VQVSREPETGRQKRDREKQAEIKRGETERRETDKRGRDRGWGMAQVVEQQSCKPKALSSNPILPKKRGAETE